MTQKLPSIKDLRKKGYGKEVIDKIADITSPNFCKDPWDSVTIPVLKSRGKSGVIHIHRTTLEDEDIFDVKLHSCDEIKCSHMICSKGCDVSHKPPTTPLIKNELPKKESVKSRKGSKFSFLRGTRPQRVASVPSLSMKSQFKKNTLICNAEVVEGNIDFNDRKEGRTSKRKPSCVLYVYSGGKKRKVGFQLQPEIELFLARSLDKIENYTGKISCESKKSLRKEESKKHSESMPFFLEKPSETRKEESSKLTHNRPNNETPNISRSSSGVSNPYAITASSEKSVVPNKEMLGEKHKKEERLKSSLKMSRSFRRKEEDKCTTLICVPGSCNCQETNQCVVNMDYKDYNKAKNSRTSNSQELGDSVNVVYQICPSHGDIHRKIRDKAGDPFSTDSLNLEEKYASNVYLKVDDHHRNQNKFRDHKSIIDRNSIHVRNDDKHRKHVDHIPVKKSSMDYCVPKPFCNVNTNKNPHCCQGSTPSKIPQCPIHKNPIEDYQMSSSIPYGQQENHPSFFVNSHEYECKINHKSMEKMEKNPNSEMQYFEKDVNKQCPVKECCQFNKQSKPGRCGKIYNNEKYYGTIINKSERSSTTTEEFCFMNAGHCDVFGVEISENECACGCISADMTCRCDADQMEHDERYCYPGECTCEPDSCASSGGTALSEKGGIKQIRNYQRIEESNVLLQKGVPGKMTFSHGDSQSHNQTRLLNNIPHRLRNEYSSEIIKNPSLTCRHTPSPVVHQKPTGCNCKGPDLNRENQDYNCQYHINPAHVFVPKIPKPYISEQTYIMNSPKSLSKLPKKQNFQKNFDDFSPCPQNCNKYIGFVRCETDSPFQFYENSSNFSFRNWQVESINESYKSQRKKKQPIAPQFVSPTHNNYYKMYRNDFHKKSYFSSPEELKSSEYFENMDSYKSKMYLPEMSLKNDASKELKRAMNNRGENDNLQRELDCHGSMIPKYLNTNCVPEVFNKLKLSENSQTKYIWSREEHFDKLLTLTIGALYCVQPFRNIQEKNNRNDDLTSILNLIFNRNNKEFLIRKFEIQNNSRRLLKVLFKYGLNDLQVSNIIKMFSVLYSYKPYHYCLNNIAVFGGFKEEDKQLGNIAFLRIVRALSLKFIPKLLKQKKLKNYNQIHRRNETHSRKFVSSKFACEYGPGRNNSAVNNQPKFNTSALSATEFGTNFLLSR